MNMVSRSPEAGKSIMPPMANMVSGNTSVCMIAALIATCSVTLPGTAEACGVNACKPDEADPPVRRSAMSRTPITATARMAPCRNSAGRSTVTEPMTACWPVPIPR